MRGTKMQAPTIRRALSLIRSYLTVQFGDKERVRTRIVVPRNKTGIGQVSVIANLEQTDMAENLECAEGTAPKATTESGRFDRISIALHWLTVLLIIVQFASAWLREAVDHDTRLAAAILASHQTTGALTWIVGLVRLVWRRTFAHLPPFPKSMPQVQQWIAKANEYGLYALLLVQPITGLGSALFRGHPFELFIWEVSTPFEHNVAIRSLFVEAHEFGAKALLALIGLHAGAALFHHLVLRDDVLQRMLPWTSARTPAQTNKAEPQALLLKNYD
jgi:cytochrome b561